jgi:hypothetical protein
VSLFKNFFFNQLFINLKKMEIFLNEEKYIKQVPSDYICTVCLCIVQNPQEINECGHLFCKECISKCKKNKCPNCNERFEKERLIESKLTKRRINNLEVSCKNDCGSIICIGDLLKHHEICPEEEVTCPNENCSENFKRKDDEHLLNCEFRSVYCKLCDIFIIKNKEQEHNEKECLGSDVKCPNCEVQLKKKI